VVPINGSHSAGEVDVQSFKSAALGAVIFLSSEKCFPTAVYFMAD